MYQVIIVEDDPMVAEIDRQYVEMDRAFQVAKVCRDGREALDWLDRHQADLVILDFYTPAMTGLEFVDQLHGRGQFPSIIMVTSADDTWIIRELKERGVLDYLIKPFQYSRFQRALERFHHIRRLMGEERSAHLNQSSVDQLFGEVSAGEKQKEPLAKGLNAGTLEKVEQFFQTHPGQSFTGEEVAEQVGLSRITIRRYVSYMSEAGKIESSIDYQTGGRPAIRYSVKEAAGPFAKPKGT